MSKNWSHPLVEYMKYHDVNCLLLLDYRGKRTELNEKAMGFDTILK